MNAALLAFQQAFVSALRDPGGQGDALTQQPGFSVYRNTVMKGCIDALHANYPAVARLVGEDWFRAAAADYARQAWPRDVRLMLYGEDFPEFLTQFAPAAELPYLPGVATLDRCWSESHMAEDAPVLQLPRLATMTPLALETLSLAPHPAARWRWFDGAPIHTLWSRNRRGQPLPPTLDWTGEGALLTRPHGAVQAVSVGPAACAFLDACAARHSMPRALQAGLAADPATDASALLATLTDAGALCAIAL